MATTIQKSSDAGGLGQDEQDATSPRSRRRARVECLVNQILQDIDDHNRAEPIEQRNQLDDQLTSPPNPMESVSSSAIFPGEGPLSLSWEAPSCDLLHGVPAHNLAVSTQRAHFDECASLRYSTDTDPVSTSHSPILFDQQGSERVHHPIRTVPKLTTAGHPSLFTPDQLRAMAHEFRSMSASLAPAVEGKATANTNSDVTELSIVTTVPIVQSAPKSFIVSQDKMQSSAETSTTHENAHASNATDSSSLLEAQVERCKHAADQCADVVHRLEQMANQTERRMRSLLAVEVDTKAKGMENCVHSTISPARDIGLATPLDERQITRIESLENRMDDIISRFEAWLCKSDDKSRQQRPASAGAIMVRSGLAGGPDSAAGGPGLPRSLIRADVNNVAPRPRVVPAPADNHYAAATAKLPEELSSLTAIHVGAKTGGDEHYYKHIVKAPQIAACGVLRARLTEILDPSNDELLGAALCRLKASVGSHRAIVMMQAKVRTFFAQRQLVKSAAESGIDRTYAEFSEASPQSGGHEYNATYHSSDASLLFAHGSGSAMKQDGDGTPIIHSRGSSMSASGGGRKCFRPSSGSSGMSRIGESMDSQYHRPACVPPLALNRIVLPGESKEALEARIAAHDLHLQQLQLYQRQLQQHRQQERLPVKMLSQASSKSDFIRQSRPSTASTEATRRVEIHGNGFPFADASSVASTSASRGSRGASISGVRGGHARSRPTTPGTQHSFCGSNGRGQRSRLGQFQEGTGPNRPSRNVRPKTASLPFVAVETVIERSKDVLAEQHHPKRLARPQSASFLPLPPRSKQQKQMIVEKPLPGHEATNQPCSLRAQAQAEIPLRSKQQKQMISEKPMPEHEAASVPCFLSAQAQTETLHSRRLLRPRSATVAATRARVEQPRPNLEKTVPENEAERFLLMTKSCIQFEWPSMSDAARGLRPRPARLAIAY